MICTLFLQAWCKVVHILTAYFRSATYMCMFCEGLYLYKRISNVMKVGVQDPLLKYYLISWGKFFLFAYLFVFVSSLYGCC